MRPLRIPNITARQLWLSGQGLGAAPTGPLDLMAMITQLGFVQLDTIQVVARAHHHILWSRNQNYREKMLDDHLGREAGVFEHFTHDASVLPMAFLPMWQRQFRRKRAEMDRAGWYRGLPDAAAREVIRQRIMREGPLCTMDFDSKVQGEKVMWSRPPHKLALDYMWYGGELATSHRVNFTKYYDLAERVFPHQLRSHTVADDAQIHWLCTAALDRMGFGTLTEIQRFWDATSREEVRDWAAQAALQPVEVETFSGEWIAAYAPTDIAQRVAAVPPATSRLRILSPFDPAIRDRVRLHRLFGFDYRVEMFVPAAKRIWGYYVFPILEGHRFVGRIEVVADRKASELKVKNLWPVEGVRWGAQRAAKLDAELERMRRFIGVKTMVWAT